MKKKTILVLGCMKYPLGSNKGEDRTNTGGMEVHVNNLVNELVKDSKYEVLLFSRKFKSSKEYEAKKNLKVFRVPWVNNYFLRGPSFNFNSFLKALRLDFDVIQTHGFAGAFFGSILSKVKKKPKVSVMSGVSWDQPQVPWLLKPLIKWVEVVGYSNSDLVVFSNEGEREQFFKRVTRLPLNRTVLIRKGLNLRKFKDLKYASNIKGKKIITWTGRMLEVKGLEYLLDAVARLDKEEFELWLVGGGELRSELEGVVKKRELSDKVKFLGFREDVPGILEKSDVFVSSSVSEGLPQSLLEAMAAGKPVVVTDIGLPVANGVNGLVVPAKNSEELSKALRKLLRDSKLRKKLSVKAREYALENHSLPNAIKEYKKAYSSLSPLK